MLVQIQPQIIGGLRPFKLISAATTNPTLIKTGAGGIFGWHIYNSNVSDRKIAFHDIGTTPVAGTTPVYYPMVISGRSLAFAFTDIGVSFANGIAFTTTVGFTDTDATAVAASDLIISIFWQ